MKRALHWAGALLCIAAVVFFVREIMATGLQLPPGGTGRAATWLAGAALAYAASVAMLAWLWSLLLLQRGADRALRAEVVSGYLVSQFGKYLPGNVFHYLGRHALGRRLGITHAALGSAAVVEIGFLLAATAFVVATCASGLPREFWWLRPAAIAAGVAGLVALFAAPRLLPRLVPLPGLDATRFALLAPAYLAFVTVFGLLYAACLWLFGATLPLQDAVGSAALGWAVGFLVPGAPAGAGLREAALALTLGGREATAVTSAIVAFRIVTMLGDFIAFLAGLLMRRLAGGAAGADLDATTMSPPPTKPESGSR